MNTFIPWPVSPSTPAAPFPPGAFCLDLGAGPFSMWFDDQVSFDIVPWHALAAPSQGPTFSVWFNDQGQSQLDATLFREPYAADNDILARYLIADDQWKAGPAAGHYLPITTALAPLLHAHHASPPPLISPGELIVDCAALEPVIHLGTPSGCVRFVNSSNLPIEYGGPVEAREFTILNADRTLDIIRPARLVIRPDAIVYTQSLYEGVFTTPLINDDVPDLLLQLREYLWNDGRPLTPLHTSL